MIKKNTKLQIYNTYTQQKEEFVPLDKNHVRMYVCGPTVYDYIHLGNARPNVVFDVLFRVLKVLYPKVTYVRNITDVEDRINERAKERNISISELTAETTQYFLDDMKALGVLEPTVQPRATDHIQEMLVHIEKLVNSKHAYVAEGHVLFDTSSMEDYGALSKRNIKDLIAGARVEVAPYKKNPTDFVLWKPSSDGDPGWDSPWGRGRPGWHIECSAMSEKHLGPSFDIHGGGVDLVFPHHENERAQSLCGNPGHCYAKYWMHNGMLNVDGKKMSKSLGNFTTTYDVLKKYPGEVIRFILLMAHYRQPVDFTKEAFLQAKSQLDRFYTAIQDFDEDQLEGGQSDIQVMADLLDDLNTPKAIASLNELVTNLNKETDANKKLDLAKRLKASAYFLGLLSKSPEDWFHSTVHSGQISAEAIQEKIEERQRAKQNKNFALADEIRSELLDAGILLQDSPQGTTWKYSE